MALMRTFQQPSSWVSYFPLSLCNQQEEGCEASIALATCHRYCGFIAHRWNTDRQVPSDSTSHCAETHSTVQFLSTQYISTDVQSSFQLLLSLIRRIYSICMSDVSKDLGPTPIKEEQRSTAQGGTQQASLPSAAGSKESRERTDKQGFFKHFGGVPFQG